MTRKSGFKRWFSLNFCKITGLLSINVQNYHLKFLNFTESRYKNFRNFIWISSFCEIGFSLLIVICVFTIPRSITLLPKDTNNLDDANLQMQNEFMRKTHLNYTYSNFQTLITNNKLCLIMLLKMSWEPYSVIRNAMEYLERKKN